MRHAAGPADEATTHREEIDGGPGTRIQHLITFAGYVRRLPGIRLNHLDVVGAAVAAPLG